MDDDFHSAQVIMSAMKSPQDNDRDPLTHRIIGAAIRVSKSTGIGLLESAYEAFLCYELGKLGLTIRRQQPLPVVYDGVRLDLGFRPDIIVENAVIIEIKTVKKFLPVHDAQLLTYLRLSGIRVGLLLNFSAFPFTTGIRRLVY
jgi:GxxExxY protein